MWELLVLYAVKLDLIDFQLRIIHLSSFWKCGILNVMSYKWALTKNIVSNIVIKVCFSVLKCWTWHSKCSVVTNVCPALYKYSAINQFRIGHNFWHLNLIKALLSLVLWPELVSLTLSLHQSKFGDNWQLSFLPHSKVSNLFFASLQEFATDPWDYWR